MRVDMKRLSKAGRAWLDAEGRPIDLSRVERVALRARAATRLRARMLAAAAEGDEANRRWFVLAVTKRDEKAVEKLISDAGIETWLPTKTVEKWLVHKRKKVEVVTPIFAGIVFVRVVARPATWAGLQGVDGVFSVFGTAAGPAFVSDREVNKFRGFCEKGMYDEKAEAGFVAGARVRVAAGLLQGNRATVLGYKRTRQDRIWVQLFGSHVPCEIALANLAIDE